MIYAVPHRCSKRSLAAAAFLPAALLASLLGVAGLDAASAAPPTSIRVGVVPGIGERAPGPNTVTLLTVVLSQQENVVCLEREDILRVLKEQQLGAAGIADPRNAAKLGQILAAEALVTVEKLPGPAPAVVRLQFVDVRTGIVLAAEVLAETPPEPLQARAAALVKQALAKLRLPDADRRYVGILGFRSEEIGHSLDPWAEALGMLVSVDLSAADKVIVLDRSNLQRLRSEETLTGVELALKTSALLLSGGLQRSADQKTVTATVMVALLAGGGQKVSLAAPAEDLAALRTALTAKLLEVLKTSAPDLKHADPAAEAKRFADQVWMLYSHGEKNAALASADTALALYPTQEYRGRAADLWHNTWNDAFFADTAVWDDWTRQKKDPATRPPETKVRALEAALRSWDLLFAVCREETRRWDAGENTDDKLRHLIGLEQYADFLGGNMQFPCHSPDAEELVAELRDRLVRERHMLLDYYEKHLDDSTMSLRYWRELASLLIAADNDGRRGEREEWLQYVDLAFAKVAAHAGGKVDRRGRREFFDIARGSCFGSGPLDKTPLIPLMDRLIKSDDPYLRLKGYTARVGFSKGEDAESARKALDTLVRDLPLDHPERQNSYETGLANDVAPCLPLIPDPQERGKYYQAILDPVIAGQNAGQLVSWRQHIIAWIRLLSATKQEIAARALAQRTLDSLRADRSTAGLLFDRVAPFEKELQPWLPPAKATDDVHAAAPDDTLLRNFDVRRLMARPPVDGAVVRQVAVLDGELFLLWSAPQDALAVTRLSLQDGSTASLGVWAGAVGNHHRANLAPADRDTAYVSTIGAGLIRFQAGATRVWTEKDSLPSNSIGAVACHKGKVYLGFHKASSGALVELDPEKGTFTTLASSRSLAGRSPLDGGATYDVLTLAADPMRDRIWLWIVADQRSGLWSYSPAAARFARAWNLGWGGLEGNGRHQPLSYLRLCGKQILIMQWGQVALFDPETLRKSWELGQLGGGGSFEGGPGAQMPRSGDQPQISYRCASLGEWLITATRRDGFQLRKGDLGNPTPLTIPGVTETPPPQEDFPPPSVERWGEALVLVGVQGGVAVCRVRPASEAWVALKRPGVVPVARVAASPAARTGGFGWTKGLVHGPEDAIDDNLRSSWAGAAKELVGAWIEFGFPQTVTLARVRIADGWEPYDQGFFPYNHRAKTISVLCDGVKTETLNLKDQLPPQDFTFAKPLSAQTVRFVIDGIYEGKVGSAPFDDPRLMISEVTFFSDAKESAGPPYSKPGP